MLVFYEIHKIFDVIPKVAMFIAQVYISRNFAKFLQQCIVTQCTDEKTFYIVLNTYSTKSPTPVFVSTVDGFTHIPNSTKAPWTW